jgi:hypothetical protein
MIIKCRVHNSVMRKERRCPSSMHNNSLLKSISSLLHNSLLERISNMHCSSH